jgi:hypothetical protein
MDASVAAMDAPGFGPVPITQTGDVQGCQLQLNMRVSLSA